MSLSTDIMKVSSKHSLYVLSWDVLVRPRNGDISFSVTFLSMVKVHITVTDNNDNAPIFSQPFYDVTISEDTPPDTEVVQVQALDRDEYHRLSYTLQSAIDPNSMRLFRIHPTMGTIYTTQSLDHEACAQHILTVMVRDIYIGIDWPWSSCGHVYLLNVLLSVKCLHLT